MIIQARIIGWNEKETITPQGVGVTSELLMVDISDSKKMYLGKIEENGKNMFFSITEAAFVCEKDIKTRTIKK